MHTTAEPSSNLPSSPPPVLPSSRLTLRGHVVTVLVALLFVPLFIVTIGTWPGQAPWGVHGIVALCGVAVTWIMGWLVFPFAVGVWCRRWWWPALCLGVVLAAAFAWNGGQASIGPGLDSRAAPTLTVWVVPSALVLGGIAAGMAAVGVILASPVRRSNPDALRGWTVAGLVMAMVPVTVTWIALLGGPILEADSPLRQMSLDILPAAALVLFGIAWRIGSAGWVVACLVVLNLVAWVWGVAYIRDLAPHYPSLNEAGVFLLVFVVSVPSLIVAGLASLSVVFQRDE